MTKPRSLSSYADDNSIPGSRLQDGSVDSLQLAEGAVTQDKIDSNVSFPVPDESIDNDKVSPVAAIQAAKLSFLAQNGTTRTVQNKLGDYTNIKDFGAVGDGEHDDTEAFLAAVEAARASNRMLFFPPGEFVINQGTPSGTSIGVVGSGIEATKLKIGTFYAPVFDFENSPGFRPMRDFSARGNVRYGGPSFLDNSNGYASVIENILLVNFGEGINIRRSYSSWIRNIRIAYIANPIYLSVANGVSVRDVYVQRYTGQAIRVEQGAPVFLDNIIAEYGYDNNATAIYLMNTVNTSINGLYTEGGAARDIILTFKNSTSCYNTTIKNCFLNANSDTPIILRSSRGVEIDNINIFTPSDDVGDNIISFEGSANGPAYVGFITQYDGLTSSDERGNFRRTQFPLRSISNDNKNIILTKPFPQYGNGTSDDATNLANNTVVDSSGLRPMLLRGVSDYKSNSVTGFDCSASSTTTFGTASAGIRVFSEDYGSFKLTLKGTMSNSSGNVPSSFFQVNNATSGDLWETTSGAGPDSNGGEFSVTLYSSVIPGENLITVAMKRSQGGGGINTLSATDYSLF